MGRHTAEIRLPLQDEIAADRARRQPQDAARIPPLRSALDPAVAARVQRDLRTVRTAAWASAETPTPDRFHGGGPSTGSRPEPAPSAVLPRPQSQPQQTPAARFDRPATGAAAAPDAAAFAPTDEANRGDALTGFRVRRTLALAACAVAVLGAVSGAAVLLPDGGSAGAAETVAGPSAHTAPAPSATP